MLASNPSEPLLSHHPIEQPSSSPNIAPQDGPSFESPGVLGPRRFEAEDKLG